MSGYVVQVTLVFLLLFILAQAVKPPGYVAPPKEYDPDPPKYEYGYRIQDDKATQGKDEQRDGIYAQGRYYVENGTESSQNVKYFADDWGYHPVVEYNNTGPHSKSSTNFVLGQEAIKLKNNQISIPQDPSDPGKAVNLAALDPVSQQLDPSVNQPEAVLPQPTLQTQLDLSSIPQQLLIHPQSPIQDNLAQNNDPVLINYSSPSSTPQPKFNFIIQQQQEEPNVSKTQPQTFFSNDPQLILPNQPHLQVQQQEEPDQTNKKPQTLFSSQPQLILQNEPHLQVLTNDPNQELQNRQFILDPSLQSQPTFSGGKQPIFFFVQPQQIRQDLSDDIPTAIDGLARDISEFFRKQPLQASEPQGQPLVQSETKVLPKEDQNIQRLEALPQPQALIFDTNKQYETSSGPMENIQQINNGIKAVNENNESKQIVETAPLIKNPNQIVDFNNNSPQIEFGTRLNFENTKVNHNKLIESTRNLVSGEDVLNINAAISNEYTSGADNIETNTLQSLLQQYVTPTIISNNLDIDVGRLDVVSSTTTAPILSTMETSLLNEPIIAAESDADEESKPVTEKTDENKKVYSSTARATLAKIDKKTEENSSVQVLVTPRPVSSKFLAPITAGVQLQQVEEQIFQDLKSMQNQNTKQEKVSVQIQKTIPYYLGMYEYPLGYDLQSSGLNITDYTDMSAEQKAVKDIELGKTLLYFPEQETPRSEALIQPLINIEQSQNILEVNTNHLASYQYQKESSVENLQEQNQLLVNEQENVNAIQEQAYMQERPSYNTIQQKIVEKIVEKPVPYPQFYPVEKIVEKQVHVPIEVPKYIDRPYPVEVRIPYPQPYPVEKVVQKVVKEPYPVEVKIPVQVEIPVPHPVPVDRIVEKPIPVPYYIEKPVERIVEKPISQYIDRPYLVQEPASSQAILLQIPGLFSQQKYSTLVQDNVKSENIKLQNYYANSHQFVGKNQVSQAHYPFVYAPQNVQYLAPKQLISVAKTNVTPKLRKLNLLVFPRQNIFNLPPVTKNPHNLFKQAVDHQSYRYSNAQLNNGYLPPDPKQNFENNHQFEGSASNVKNAYSVQNPEEHHIGLVPPRRPLFEDSRSHRHARAHFDDKSVRLEYGFMPPLIPSLEIDEQGQPIEKDDNKN